ncbi:13814_t:CDS:2 [Funneliformis mosseae]|uniref:13814_t:CDS:1 n=1 Tax=Funneliformis mosseae TaxID=27381 RepID=A0A9N9DDD2_FUNMO|nr:13814_t:CDS:2 [Funneliformis mosseae]
MIADRLLIDYLVRYYERIYANIGYTFYSGVERQNNNSIFILSTMIHASALRIADERFRSQLWHAEHILAFGDWYGKHNKKDHFNIPQCKILDGAVQNGMKHVKLWQSLIKKISHESIIPV